MKDVTLAILAGGRGSRMGQTKDHVTIAGRPILLHLLDQLQFAGPTLLVASPQQPQPIGYEALDQITFDQATGAGPLAGILAALSASTTDQLCILSVDMPNIGQDQVRWLCDEGHSRPESNGLLCRRIDNGDAKIEPFPSYLRRISAAKIAAHFSAGGRSLHSLTSLPGFVTLDTPQSWPTSTWLNLNFPEDLQQVGGKLG